MNNPAIDITNEEAENFFTKILRRMKNFRENSPSNSPKKEENKKNSIQFRRMQLLRKAVEEDDFETLETFFEIIQQKRYTIDEQSYDTLPNRYRA
jgi:hypothetical protein